MERGRQEQNGLLRTEQGSQRLAPVILLSDNNSLDLMWGSLSVAEQLPTMRFTSVDAINDNNSISAPAQLVDSGHRRTTNKPPIKHILINN